MTTREMVQIIKREKIRFCSVFPVTRIQVCCVAAGFILYGVMRVMATEAAGAWGGGLVRASHGGGELLYDVLVAGLDEELEISLQVPVREREHSAQEAEALYDKLLPELVTEILGENESLRAVREDLNLLGSLDAYGLKFRWESENPDILDSFGIVRNENLPEAQDLYLKVMITDGEHEREYVLSVTVLPPLLTDRERQISEFEKTLIQMDEEQKTEEQFVLPAEYKGRKLQYKMVDETDYRILPVLGVLLAVLYHVREKVEEKEKKKKREQQLLVDYSEVVSKLMVFIGAGMTVRIAWERIVDGYERVVEKGQKEVRPAYEEMRDTVSRLRSGTPESRAYEEFGRRCGLQPYLKLGALLEQNRKTGSKNLHSALESEMVLAFEERKNLAKRLGEEAGTKLLLPLFLMLGIIMVMIVVPAFLSFY